jgi:hypothetical protein
VSVKKTPQKLKEKSVKKDTLPPPPLLVSVPPLVVKSEGQKKRDEILDGCLKTF